MNDQNNDPDPPFCGRGLLVDPNGGAVDHLDVAIMRGRDGVHHPIPYPGLSPSHEAIVARRAWAITLGQIAPWGAGSQHPEDAIEHSAVIDPGHAAWLVGKQRFDHAPFEVSQVILAHGKSESEHCAL